MLSKLQRIARNYLNLGVNDNHNAEVNRQIVVINLFAAVGLSITFVLGTTAIVRDNLPLAFSLYAASFLFYLSHLFLRVKRLKKGYRVSANLLLYSLIILMLFLIHSGGSNNTGPLWVFLIPPVALFFGGLRKGLRDIGLFVMVAATIMFYPEEALLATSYSYEFKTRILYSFLTATFLSAFYEYSRENSYRQIQELSDKFEQQARQDPLTRLPNRRAMREHLEYEHNRSKRSKQIMSVLLCDIDYFKKINDIHGHDAGDAVLKQISGTFQKALRKQDIVARWGGEEFLFLLPETSEHEAHILAEKVRKKVLNSDFHHNNQKIASTISIGLAEVPVEMSVDQAINLADHQLYQAKEAGRNQTRPSFS